MAFVIVTFADRIVGWWVSRFAKTDFVLDALEQVLRNRTASSEGRIGPSLGSPLSWFALQTSAGQRDGQYLSIRYTERLTEAGIKPSVGSVAASYDNALAETINSLYKTELIYR